MELTQQQASVVLALLSKSVNKVNDKLVDFTAIAKEHEDVTDEQVDEFAKYIAQLESYSACIVILLRYLPDNDDKRRMLKIARNNLQQAKKFFRETGMSYGTVPL